ncbi:hypothetical protein HELRODRAFT_160375 [Helobdella robusta]|uniref:Uncharacterized protein n=1 Tax=Helobdella robusta TaxID=6412 RepID=T1EQ60_HELRO|nr:hypothetical protein HELRODRAFT_160375 [Helobdella robusta]ESO06217.1 hypothetical protein HELRODRAFT_160375 [Helobdella robusta]
MDFRYSSKQKCFIIAPYVTIKMLYSLFMTPSCFIALFYTINKTAVDGLANVTSFVEDLNEMRNSAIGDIRLQARREISRQNVLAHERKVCILNGLTSAERDLINLYDGFRLEKMNNDMIIEFYIRSYFLTLTENVKQQIKIFREVFLNSILPQAFKKLNKKLKKERLQNSVLRNKWLNAARILWEEIIKEKRRKKKKGKLKFEEFIGLESIFVKEFMLVFDAELPDIRMPFSSAVPSAAVTDDASLSNSITLPLSQWIVDSKKKLMKLKNDESNKVKKVLASKMNKTYTFKNGIKRLRHKYTENSVKDKSINKDRAHQRYNSHNNDSSNNHQLMKRLYKFKIASLTIIFTTELLIFCCRFLRMLKIVFLLCNAEEYRCCSTFENVDAIIFVEPIKWREILLNLNNSGYVTKVLLMTSSLICLWYLWKASENVMKNEINDLLSRKLVDILIQPIESSFEAANSSVEINQMRLNALELPTLANVLLNRRKRFQNLKNVLVHLKFLSNYYTSLKVSYWDKRIEYITANTSNLSLCQAHNKKIISNYLFQKISRNENIYNGKEDNICFRENYVNLLFSNNNNNSSSNNNNNINNSVDNCYKNIPTIIEKRLIFSPIIYVNNIYIFANNAIYVRTFHFTANIICIITFIAIIAFDIIGIRDKINTSCDELHDHPNNNNNIYNDSYYNHNNSINQCNLRTMFDFFDPSSSYSQAELNSSQGSGKVEM